MRPLTGRVQILNQLRSSFLNQLRSSFPWVISQFCAQAVMPACQHCSERRGTFRAFALAAFFFETVKVLVPFRAKRRTRCATRKHTHDTRLSRRDSRLLLTATRSISSLFTHSVCFTEQQLVGFRSREGQAVGGGEGIRRERALSRRKESTSVSVSQVNPIVRIVWYRENGSFSLLQAGCLRR
jgi:hypothetical protein